MQLKRMRPSPAMVVASVALFVTLGGTGYAAQRYLITSSSQIKDSTIRSADIRDGSVGVRDLSGAAKRGLGTQSKAKIAAVVEEVITDPQYGISITVKGEKGVDGAAGTAGSTGPQGAQGAQGEPGITDIQRVDGSSVELGTQGGPNALKQVTASCPSGTTAISGGVVTFGSRYVIASTIEPLAGASGFRAELANTSGVDTATARLWALCAVVG